MTSSSLGADDQQLPRFVDRRPVDSGSVRDFRLVPERAGRATVMAGPLKPDAPVPFCTIFLAEVCDLGVAAVRGWFVRHFSSLGY